MKKTLLIFPSIILLLLLVYHLSGTNFLSSYIFSTVRAQENNSNVDYLQKQKEIEELEQKVVELQKQSQTLSSQINYMNSQIQLTTLKIAQTEEEITTLTTKIGRLEVSLDFLAQIVGKRISATYKKGEVDPFALFLSSDDFSDFVTRYKYLKVVQIHDKKLLLSMEETRTNYDDQKKEVEKLKARLDSQKLLLDKQKKDKEYLLTVTKADEKKYQELLKQARAELEAILNILAGRGSEAKIGPVAEGSRIASVIQGSSCSSSGTHLHFMVANGQNAQNPLNFLKPGVSYENCSGYSCGGSEGDPFNPSGSWNWPVNPPIKFNQGFGVTWSIQNIAWLRGWYSSHNGIDINGSSPEVKAVKNGTLYRGNYHIRSLGCALPYVRMEHEDVLQTYYLHIQ